MPRKEKKKDTIRANTIEDMKKLGVYKPEYEPIIDIYCELREQYELYTKQLKDKEYKCDEYTAAGGTKKSALIATLENLRKDILQYSDRLCLNPKANSNIEIPKQGKSKLAEALGNLK